MAEKHKMNPNSLKNLRTWDEAMTPEQRQAGRRKGGQVSAQNRRKRKLFSEIIAEIGLKNVSKRKMSDSVKALADMYGIEGDITADTLVMLAQYEKATHGDTDAARFIRDTSGQNPAQILQIGPFDAQTADLSQMSDSDLLAREQELLTACDGNFDGNT